MQVRVPVAAAVTTVAALVALPLASPPAAHAAPDAPAATATSSPLKRYQSRLEGEARRILAPEVQGGMKDALARRGTELWACLSMASWQRIVVAEAPSLARTCQVLERRSEVIWAEERLSDAHASPIVQMASVHALQRGLGAVLALLGVKLAPPAAVAAAPAPTRAPVTAIASTPPPTAAARRVPTAKPTPPPAPVLSPAELAAYTAALEAEAYRILLHEVEGAVLEAVVARRSPLRTATTVDAWKSALVAAHPSLGRAAAVLERRTEVLRGDLRVLDAYDSVATQRAAIRGLQQGLEKILRQFGR
jgi:hypothetical protein